ncbi:hypothetical protein GCM10012286_63030 [Streptomyces lasiicapitis]|uniref:Uncharacterized protein n=1 Tax=Streptomyces lasiicapitis TaxID=1923961 RepID=A0ABQ2MPV8_9ACTN|nr:hypothetical protein GCM10012286_63030 [Streptomyces lasiicapitis]
MRRRTTSLIATSCIALAFAIIGTTPAAAEPGPISASECAARNGVIQDISGTYYCMAVHGVIEGA